MPSICIIERRQASRAVKRDRFAARARQLRGSWGLVERPKTPRQRPRQAQLSPQLRVCFAFFSALRGKPAEKLDSEVFGGAKSAVHVLEGWK